MSSASLLSSLSGSQTRVDNDVPVAENQQLGASSSRRESRNSLRQQVQNLKDAHQELERLNASLGADNTALRDANAALSQSQESLTREVAEVKAQLNAYSENTSASEEEKQAIRDELAAANDRIVTIEAKMLAMLQEKLEIEQRVQGFDLERQTIDDEKQILGADKLLLEEQKAELEKQNKVLQDSHERITGDNTRLRTAFDSQLEKARALTEDKEVLSGKIQGLEDQLAVAEADKREAECAAQAAVEENERQVSVIQQRDQELEEIRARLEEAARRGALLATENARLRAEKESLEQEIAPLQAQCDDLIDQNAAQQADILTLQSDNDRLNSGLQEARSRLEKQEEIVYNAGNDLGKATGERDAMYLELGKEKQSRQILLASLREEKSRCSTIETELELSRAQLADTQSTNTELTQAERALRDKIVRLQKTVNRLAEAADADMTKERDLHSKVAALEAQLETRESQKRELRAALKEAQRAFAETTDRVATLETEALVRDQRVESLRHRLDEEKRLRLSTTRELRGQRVRQKELEAAFEAFQESSAEKVGDADRRALLAGERVEDLEREVNSAKTTAASLRVRVNDARVELMKCERRLVAEQDKLRALRVELQESNRMMDELDPEKLYRRLEEEKVARAADVARLGAEMGAREADLAKEKAKAAKLSAKVKELGDMSSHEQCVERGQVKDLVKIVAELFSQCEVSPKASKRYEYQYPQDLVWRGDDDKWGIKFVRKCAVRRPRW